MHRTLQTFFVVALYLGLPVLRRNHSCCRSASRHVEYQTDSMDTSKYGTNPDITPSAGILRFAPAITIGDIVPINGEPVKGTFVGRPWDLTSRTELTYRDDQLLIQSSGRFRTRTRDDSDHRGLDSGKPTRIPVR